LNPIRVPSADQAGFASNVPAVTPTSRAVANSKTEIRPLCTIASRLPSGDHASSVVAGSLTGSGRSALPSGLSATSRSSTTAASWPFAGPATAGADSAAHRPTAHASKRIALRMARL
jgi:hypothetical protein